MSLGPMITTVMKKTDHPKTGVECQIYACDLDRPDSISINILRGRPEALLNALSTVFALEKAARVENVSFKRLSTHSHDYVF